MVQSVMLMYSINLNKHLPGVKHYVSSSFYREEDLDLELIGTTLKYSPLQQVTTIF